MDWLNDNSGAVQAFLVLALVFATGYYAWKARDTARTAREQVLNSVRPVVLANQAVRGKPGQETSVDVEPSNVGVGPALNVQCTFRHPGLAYSDYWWSGMGAGRTETLITLQRQASDDRGGTTSLDDLASISIQYEDVYGRLFEALVELKQEVIGWAELRTSVRLIGDAKGRVRPTEGWQEVVIDRGQLT